MPLILPQHREPFRYFCREMVRVRDFDPNYFTLRGVCEERGYNDAQRFAYCAAFNGFYNFAGTDDFFIAGKDPAACAYGQSRRGFRANHKVLDFLSDVTNLRPFLLRQRDGGETGWRWIYDTLLANVRGCGPWSAYCLTHSFQIVMDFRISAPNVGDLGSSERGTGPTAGLQFLTGLPLPELMRNEPLHRAIYKEVAAECGGMEVFESILCNYLSVHKGRYYIGRDIDRQLPQVVGMRDHAAARRRYFPEPFLGEVGGWTGIRKELMGRLTHAATTPFGSA